MKTVLLSQRHDIMKLYQSSFKSEHTAHAYTCYLKKFGDMRSLLHLSQREAEDKLIDFIITNKEKGMSWGALHNYIVSVAKFYLINDIQLNLIRVKRFMPEHTRIVRDRPYTTNEILRVLELANERTRAIVLLLASTGVRLSVIPQLRLSDLTDKGDIYKITVYPNTDSEYYTYCTPEAKKALLTYFEIRSRHGEVLKDSSPVIREQYNKLKHRMVTYPKSTTKGAIICLLQEILERAGIRRTAIAQTSRHDVSLANGFRKFFSSQLVEADLKTELRWLLEGHSLVANDPHYVRVSESKLQQEYEKAIDALTINPENRLRRKVEKLEVEKTAYEALAAKVASLEKRVKG